MGLRLAGASSTRARTPPCPPSRRCAALWNGVSGRRQARPAPDGYASYRLLVRCPAGEQLALAVPAQRTAMRLYVNGQLAAAQGVPGASAGRRDAGASGRRAVLTEPFPCPLRITAHVSNFSHRSGGLVRAPVAGPHRGAGARPQAAPGAGHASCWAPTWCWACRRVIFFLARPQGRTPLLFGLFCLAQAALRRHDRRAPAAAAGQAPRRPGRCTCKRGVPRLVRLDGAVPGAGGTSCSRATLRAARRAGLSSPLRAARAAGGLLTPARIFTPRVYPRPGAGRGDRPLRHRGHRARGAPRPARRRRAAGRHGLPVRWRCCSNLLQSTRARRCAASRPSACWPSCCRPRSCCCGGWRARSPPRSSAAREQREKVDLLVRATQAGILDWDCTRNLDPLLAAAAGDPGLSARHRHRRLAAVLRPHPPARPRAMVHDAVHAQLRDRSVRGGEMRHEPQRVPADARATAARCGCTPRRSACAAATAARCATSARSSTSPTSARWPRACKRQNAALAENARLREDVERMSRHDLKTPLNSIIGVARLLREDAAVQPEHARAAGDRRARGLPHAGDGQPVAGPLAHGAWAPTTFRPQAVNLVDVVVARAARPAAAWPMPAACSCAWSVRAAGRCTRAPRSCCAIRSSPTW